MTKKKRFYEVEPDKLGNETRFSKLKVDEMFVFNKDIYKKVDKTYAVDMNTGDVVPFDDRRLIIRYTKS